MMERYEPRPYRAVHGVVQWLWFLGVTLPMLALGALGFIGWLLRW